MLRNSDIPAESFNELLGWLDPDREIASAVYLELRQNLVKIFGWNRSTDPEGMTDETFDRVARQVHRLRHTFEGNPKLFFYGVARNLLKEYQKKAKLHVSIEEIELPGIPPPQDVEEESAEIREECLRTCLQKLTSEKRDLVLAYYAKEKQAKIDHRSEMARQLGVEIETLRVRIFRIRVTLEECIERCLQQLGVGK